MTTVTPHPGGTVSITWARGNLGPLVRWTARTGERTTLTDRSHIVAILVSPKELTALEEAAAHQQYGRGGAQHISP